MSTDMIRKQIYIFRRQENLLKRLAHRRGVSEAEIIRQAIDREAMIETAVLAEDSHAALEEILRAAVARRELPADGEPFRFRRADIYAERESRWIRETKED